VAKDKKEETLAHPIMMFLLSSIHGARQEGGDEECMIDRRQER
jgi:hypothetical protein